MKILITGGNGFFASHIASALRDRGHEVVITVRRARNTQERSLILGRAFDSNLPAGFDAVVHAAHDVSSADHTITGTRSLFNATRRCSPGARQLFVGSYSARPDAVSEYGQVKYELERLFLEAGEPVVRPGLIAGSGGLFGRNLRVVIATPVIPLIDGGSDEVPIVSVRDAVLGTVMILEQGLTGAWNLFHPEFPTMKQIVSQISSQIGKRRIVIPIPVRLAISAVEFLEQIGVRAPFRADNLKSLEANRTRLHTSDLGRLLRRQPDGLEQCVRSSLSELGCLDNPPLNSSRQPPSLT